MRFFYYFGCLFYLNENRSNHNSCIILHQINIKPVSTKFLKNRLFIRFGSTFPMWALIVRNVHCFSVGAGIARLGFASVSQLWQKVILNKHVRVHEFRLEFFWCFDGANVGCYFQLVNLEKQVLLSLPDRLLWWMLSTTRRTDFFSNNSYASVLVGYFTWP